MALSRSYWKSGQKTELADAMGISRSQLSDILARRKGVSRKRARLFELSSERILGAPIPWEAWLFNNTTTHPAFTGQPKSRKR